MTTTGHSAAARRRAGRGRRPSAEPGDFEAHVGTHIVPTGDGHWTYTGRLPLAEVRAYVTSTCDPDATEEQLAGLVAVCGTGRCVRPAHLDRPHSDDEET